MVRVTEAMPRSLDGSGLTSTASYRSQRPRAGVGDETPAAPPATAATALVAPPTGVARNEVTVTAVLSSVVSTVPSWSVRNTCDEWVRRRAIVAPFGWPKVLLAPTETTATPGSTVASSTSDEAVALP